MFEGPSGIYLCSNLIWETYIPKKKKNLPPGLIAIPSSFVAKVLTMSFGWSAGDIVAALSLFHKLYKAFDDCNGVSGEYRETVWFLKSLTRTLEPLTTLADWDAHPTYATQIKEQVVLLKEPIDDFIQNVGKFETSLGRQARKGRHRNAARKLEWYCGGISDVSSLRNKIEMHMRVLDILLQRLTV